jgi:anti-sigma B factor antagonist
VRSNFRVTIRLERTVTVMVLAGELDLASFPQLEHALDRALESDPELVVLDLEELEFMDVAGLRSVIRSDQRLRGLRKRLVIAAPAPGVRRLLELTHQQDAIHIAASTAEALGSEQR